MEGMESRRNNRRISPNLAAGFSSFFGVGRIFANPLGPISP
jgi:hypothetical protein